jgi:Nodulin-like
VKPGFGIPKQREHDENGEPGCLPTCRDVRDTASTTSPTSSRAGVEQYSDEVATSHCAACDWTRRTRASLLLTLRRRSRRRAWAAYLSHEVCEGKLLVRLPPCSVSGSVAKLFFLCSSPARCTTALVVDTHKQNPAMEDDAPATEPETSRRAVLPSESVVILAGIALMSTAGTSYSFATYSSDLRERLALDQRGLEWLATAKDLGAYVGVAAGFFHDAYGPKRTVLTGAMLHAVGYYSLYTLCGDDWAGRRHVPVWQPALLLGAAANGAGFIDMGCLMTLMHNAGAERSLMAGVAKALLGLCGSVFTALYIAFIKPDARDFLLLLAIMPLLVGACAARSSLLPTLTPMRHPCSLACCPLLRAPPA